MATTEIFTMSTANRNKIIDEKEKINVNNTLRDDVTLLKHANFPIGILDVITAGIVSGVYSEECITASKKLLNSLEIDINYFDELTIDYPYKTYWNPFYDRYSELNFGRININKSDNFLSFYTLINSLLFLIKFIDVAFEIIGHIPMTRPNLSKEYTSYSHQNVDTKMHYQNWNSNVSPRNTQEYVILITRERVSDLLRKYNQSMRLYELTCKIENSDKVIENINNTSFMKAVQSKEFSKVEFKYYPLDIPLIKSSEIEVKVRDLKVIFSKLINSLLIESSDLLNIKDLSLRAKTWRLFELDFIDNLNSIELMTDELVSEKLTKSNIFRHFSGMEFICSMQWRDSNIIKCAILRIVIGYELLMFNIFKDFNDSHLKVHSKIINKHSELRYITWVMMNDLTNLLSNIEKYKWKSDVDILLFDNCFGFYKIYPTTERTKTADEIYCPNHCLFSAFRKKIDLNVELNMLEKLFLKSMPILFEVRQYDKNLKDFNEHINFSGAKVLLTDIIRLSICGLYRHYFSYSSVGGGVSLDFIPIIGISTISEKSVENLRFSRFVKISQLFRETTISNMLYDMMCSKYKVLRYMIREFLCNSLMRDNIYLERIKRYLTPNRLSTSDDNVYIPHLISGNCELTISDLLEQIPIKNIDCQSKSNDECIIKNTLAKTSKNTEHIKLIILDLIIQYSPIVGNTPQFIKILWFNSIKESDIIENIKFITGITTERVINIYNNLSKKSRELLNYNNNYIWIIKEISKLYVKQSEIAVKIEPKLDTENKIPMVSQEGTEYLNKELTSKKSTMRIYKLDFIDFLISKIGPISISNFTLNEPQINIKLINSHIKFLFVNFETQISNSLSLIVSKIFSKIESDNLTYYKLHRQHHIGSKYTLLNITYIIKWLITEFNIGSDIGDKIIEIYRMYSKRDSSNKISKYIGSLIQIPNELILKLKKRVNNYIDKVKKSHSLLGTINHELISSIDQTMLLFDNLRSIIIVRLMLQLKLRHELIYTISKKFNCNMWFKCQISLQKRFKLYINTCCLEPVEYRLAISNSLLNLRKFSTILVTNCCKRIPTITGHDNLGCHEIYNQLSNEEISNTFKKGGDPFHVKYLKCCYRIKKPQVLCDKIEARKKYKNDVGKCLLKKIDNIIVECGNVFENSIYEIDIVNNNVIASINTSHLDSDYNGWKSMSKSRVSIGASKWNINYIFGMCHDCGCIFKRNLKYYNDTVEIVNSCDRCTAILTENGIISVCDFSNSIKFISNKETIPIMHKIDRNFLRYLPIEFTIHKARGTNRIFSSQWKKTKSDNQNQLQQDDISLISASSTVNVNIFDHSKMKFTKENVSSEMFISKINPRLVHGQELDYIHSFIYKTFNNDSIYK